MSEEFLFEIIEGSLVEIREGGRSPEQILAFVEGRLSLTEFNEEEPFTYCATVEQKISDIKGFNFNLTNKSKIMHKPEKVLFDENKIWFVTFSEVGRLTAFRAKRLLDNIVMANGYTIVSSEVY